MQSIEGVLFEPVGCLAEFASEAFIEIAARYEVVKPGVRKKPSRSASRSYWHLLNLIDAAEKTLDESQARLAVELEIRAVETAEPYEDVLPALSELKAMGVKLLVASSLSNAALDRFVEKYSLAQFFSGVWGRDNAGGVKAAPLAKALDAASLRPERSIFLTDTLEGMKTAETLGVNAVLMMNDPDEAKRLSTHGPAGGVVSLLELPDFVRFLRKNDYSS